MTIAAPAALRAASALRRVDRAVPAPVDGPGAAPRHVDRTRGMHGTQTHRLDRRAFLTAAGATLGIGAAGAAGRPATALAGLNTPAAAAAPAPLRPFAPGDAPFDGGGRRNLAMDLLTYFVRQSGRFPGRSVYLLPAPPWFGGWESMAPRRAWDMTVPAGLPLYLLALAGPHGPIDPANVSITVDGVALPNLGSYVHNGVPALHDGVMHDHSVLDFVFAPPSPGRYRLEVRARTPVVQPPAHEDGLPATTYAGTLLLYDISVQPADALGPLLLRDPDGRVFAIHGGERRHVPDPETFEALGYPPDAVVSAGSGVLDAIAEGPPLPALRHGMLVRAADHSAVFRLDGGRRAWLRGYGGAGDATASHDDVRIVDPAVLGAIVPALQNDMLLKGMATDVYHVEGGALRKVPDWKWVTDRRLSPADTLFVPDRIIAALPQTSPHWRIPGGTWQDRSLHSKVLDRPMPYRVFLPPDYAAARYAGRRYPVIYLLHGMGGRYDEWSGYGVEEVANELYEERALAHAIVVMPQGGLGYWMNQDGGGTRWADYVARDVVAHVDATYRTIDRREARAIGGLSMGAHGAIQIALNFPHVFGIAGVHSPSIRGAEYAPGYFGRNGAFDRRDPIALVRESTLTTPPRIWIDAGEDDSWLPTAERLHHALVEKSWDHEWHVFPGEHDGWYWGDHVWDYLPYYSTAFQKNGLALYFAGE